MQNLVSDFFIYNSTGRIISGDQDLNEYSNLAKQIDAKRNALFFELIENNTVLILGCSVRVEQVGGREERIVCIGIYSDFHGHEEKVIKEFYERVTVEINDIQKFEYRLIGLWEENDLKNCGNLQDIDINENITKYIYGKLVANEKVSIKSRDSLVAVLIINSIFLKLKSFLKYDFKFTTSQYPFETDISISPIEPNPDFELDEPYMNWKEPPVYDEYYRIISEVFQEISTEIKNDMQLKDRDSLSFYAKNSAFKLCRTKVLNVFSTSQSMNKLFDLYKRDRYVLKESFKERSNQIQSMTIENELTVVDIIEICSQHSVSNYPFLDYSPSEDASLKSLYFKISRDKKSKKKLDIRLLDNNIFLSYSIKDVISCIYSGKDTELLNNLCKIEFKANDRGKEKFKEFVDSALSTYQDTQLIELLKFTSNAIKPSPLEGGKIFHDSIRTLLYTKASDFTSKLSSKEAESLDSYFGTDYSAQKRNKRNNKRKRILTFVPYILFFCFFIAILVFLLMPDNPSGEDLFDSTNKYFTVNTTSGTTPLTVQFTDNTTNATEWKWDIDGDGIIEYTEKDPVHIYNESGIYNVSLTTLDDNNMSLSDTVTVIVQNKTYAEWLDFLNETILP